MTQEVHHKSISFICSIAYDCLRDFYLRGKYLDVFLPMLVLSRLGAFTEQVKADSKGIPLKIQFGNG